MRTADGSTVQLAIPEIGWMKRDECAPKSVRCPHESARNIF